jgi:hypothetical membrane protein
VGGYRTAGYLGIAAAILSWGGMFVFGALRPDYSHAVNAVSELGALGAPNALWWNVIGFIIPGLLLSVAGGAVALAIHGRRTLAFWLLVVSGLGFAGTGLSPAEVRDGIAVVTSPFTQGHFIASIVHGLTWIIATILLFRPMLRDPTWQRIAYVSLALALMATLASFALRGTVSDALVQRAAGGLYFAWVVVMSLRLVTRPREGGKPGPQWSA